MKNMTFKVFLLVTTAALTSSCSLLLPDRSFIEEMERDSMYQPGRDFPVVAGDDGDVRISKEELTSRTPSSERAKRLNKEAASIVDELIQKEDAMEEADRERYALDKKFLQTDSDKLYYISLSPLDRRSYIQTKKSDLKEDLEHGRNMVSKHSVHGGELFLGMDKNEVVAMWGKPARVEIAGNPANQNERWSFREDGSVRQVYFEGGKVQGWALDL